MTAAWQPHSSEFLSAKAKAQLRDKNGRWIEMGAMVKFWGSHGRSDQNAKQRYGRVMRYRDDVGSFEVRESGAKAQYSPVLVKPENMEVVKAVIPDAQDPIDPQGLDMSPEAATRVYARDLKPGDIVKTAQGPREVVEVQGETPNVQVQFRNLKTGELVPWGSNRMSYQVYDHPELHR